MTEKAYFLSDLHLGSDKEPNALLLLEFLQSFQSKEHITHLFLLGDVFDLWIADYPYFRRRYSAVCKELSRLVRMGVQVHFFEGNHDLYLKHYFGKTLDIKIHEGPTTVNIGRYRIRLEHGDQMDPSDRGYLVLRWLLRTRVMKWLAPRLPEKFVVWLGDRMSNLSRKYTSHVKTISSDRAKKVIRKHAEMLLSRGATFDLFISGHIHVVEDLSLRKAMGPKIQNVRVINLGAWFDGARVFVVDDLEPRFLDFHANSR